MTLKKERVSRGWTQSKLATLTGIAATDLRAVENGKRPLYPAWRRRTARAMGITESALEVRNEINR